MTKHLMFKLRLDARDRERLDAIAEQYSAPAATVLRILIKREFDSLHGGAFRAAPRTEPATDRQMPPPLRSRGLGQRTKPTGHGFVALAENVEPSPETAAAPKKKRRARKS